MTFDKVVKLFIETLESDKKGSTSITYKRKIYVFHEYVTLKLQAKDVNYQSILSAMTMQQLVNGVEYYVETYDIKYVATVDTYITVVGLFFDYISDKFGWKNPLYESKSKKLVLKAAYDRKILEIKLNTKEQINPLTDEKADQLLEFCDNKIDNAEINAVINGKNNGVFSGYISSLVSKLVLLYGTKNAIINEMKVEDYDQELNKLYINGFGVHLPDKLAVQMKQYLNIRTKIIGDEKEERLFVDIVEGKRKLDYSKLFFILKEVTGNTKAMSIAKHSIIQMIKLGIPFHIIKEFTGYSNEVYKYCQEIVDEENGVLMMGEKNKLLDSTIRKSKLYDIM